MRGNTSVDARIKVFFDARIEPASSVSNPPACPPFLSRVTKLGTELSFTFPMQPSALRAGNRARFLPIGFLPITKDDNQLTSDKSATNSNKFFAKSERVLDALPDK